MMPKPPDCRYEVAVVGLGYVGIPLVLGFAEAGCRTLGYDLNTARIKQLKAGYSPLSHLPATRVAHALEGGFLEFTDDKDLLSECEAIVICVPTPLDANLNPDLSYVLKAGEVIASCLRRGTLVSLESSTYPGTTREVLRGMLEEKSGLRAGIDFALAFSPEREDPGNALSILAEIPKVVGGFSGSCLERATELYSHVVKRVVPVRDCDTAEAVKLTENIFRYVNIALVNDLKRIYSPMGIDIWEVVQAAATKPFGFMPFFPGAGVGGHCIPVDPYYLIWKARELGLNTSFIELAGQINRTMPDYVVAQLIEGLKARSQTLNGCPVLVVGVAYKKNISDDRESPSSAVMDLLQKQGAEVHYYDPLVPSIPAHCVYNQWVGQRSIDWNPENLTRYGAAVVCTAHRGVNYSELADHLPLIVDTCNVVPKDHKAFVIAA
jgi:UDP-N-acetyl-D-glucosamine dehydrogenase